LSGTLLLLLSSILFGIMAFEAKRASAHLTGAEVAFWRFAIGLAVLALSFGLRVVRPRFHHFGMLALRGVFGAVAVLCYFTSIAHIDVSIATLLNFTSPAFVALFATVFLGERLSLRLLAALSLTVGGVALLARSHAPPGSWGFGRWEGVGLLGAAASGAAITTIRGLRVRDVGAWEIFTSFCVFGLLCTAPQAFSAYASPSATQWISLGAVGLLAVVAQLMMNHALGSVGAAVSGPIYQVTPVTTLVLGALFLGEPVNALAVVGTVLTLGGVWWATRLA
jgi:drug/metabolite transporter (DMT)-like permease